MDAYYPMKMKRKDLDDVYDEFSDFSLSSPARKIRRLIVLFKPMDTPHVHSPSNFSLKVNPQFINGFKSQVFWENCANAFRPADSEETPQDDSGSAKECLAVVPWVPSQLPSAEGAEVLGQTDNSDMMDAEDMEGVAMDVEDDNQNAEPRTTFGAGAVSVNEGLHPWQQQHCMTTQLPQNTSTPIVWYR
ncbi:uncharacterized protein LOC132066389 [Lycium ferocissimum]|uniref:uncharacterized protein LOC132066389 n=1 Tax=Lycium ferocissimum TaxID=112874 RepID=UPI0028154075|nr:uncharacterized protein LOC132066389 [Lycium ferocissimum]